MTLSLSRIAPQPGVGISGQLSDWVFRVGQLGVWVYNTQDDSWWLSRECRDLFGWAENEQLSHAAFCGELPGLERLRVEAAWSRLLGEGQAYDLEYRVNTPSGERLLWERAAYAPDSQGGNTIIYGLVQDISELRAEEQQIRFRANHDALTALPNRHMLDEFLQKSVALARRRNEQMALMAIDLDRFKQVNDTYGHAAGDFVLKEAAQRMQACLRASDFLARQGGDEFLAVLHGLDYEAAAGLIALRLIEEVSRPYSYEGQSLSIGASVGIVLLPQEACSIEQMMALADSALYGAKRAGRETLCFSD